MKRTFTLLMALAVLVALALPASAGKGGKPGKGKPLYDVEMAFVEVDGLVADGLATTCSEPLVMEGNPDVRLTRVHPSAIEIMIRDLGSTQFDWERKYPEAATQLGFDECHGPPLGDGRNDRNGLFMLTMQGDTVEFMWHFDYFIEWTPKTKGKPSYYWTALENLSLRSGPIEVDWTEDDAGARSATIEGEFSLVRFLRDADEDYGWMAPFDGSPQTFKFTLTITPR